MKLTKLLIFPVIFTALLIPSTAKFNKINAAGATITCTSGFNDNFELSTINTAKWSLLEIPGSGTNAVNNSGVSISGGTLNSSITGTPGVTQYGGLMTADFFSGDFSAKVDVTDLSGDINTLGAMLDAAIFLFSDISNRTTIAWQLSDNVVSYPQGSVFLSINEIGGIRTSVNSPTSPSHSTVTLIIERRGSKGYVYYDLGSGPQLLGTHQSVFTGPARIGINAFKQNDNTVSASFDNFSIACPTNLPNTAISSSILTENKFIVVGLLLLSLGLLSREVIKEYYINTKKD